ncbi:hypothetical protein DYBT9275_00858 [Dyadobacter sp. CECT 9275]|uniref:PqqD family protein n=1 Tax=Dyadobacter helix TaxID=2822344 RepID=A0A916JCH1_9BACT|nr:PqqD family protein [Dyadobacter sp. CECT 9275]CAG4991933.1 hypothetical protein DYBT9275_00858 [Dyadobacter sp. CECT 9275]
MKYQLTSQQIASKVAGETVILNYAKGSYYGLDEVGVLVWDNLERGPQTLDSLCEAVTAEYEIDGDTCRNDVALLLKELVEESLVKETE